MARMDDELLLRIEDSLGVYDRTHHNPVYPDHRDPISTAARALVAEVRRLRQIAQREAVEAARAREENEHLRHSLQVERELNKMHCEAQNDLEDKVEALERENRAPRDMILGGPVYADDDAGIDAVLLESQADPAP